METLRDLIEEAKRRTILVAILVLIVAYIMSLTSSSVWINLPVSVIVLAALRRLSFEVEFRWRPRTSEGRRQYPLHQNRRQLTKYDPLLSGLPCQVAVTRWRRMIDSPVVEDAVDELTRAVIDEFITGLWYSSITPDLEAPEEVRILLNGVIAEVVQRAKRVNPVTLLSKDVVDLVGSHFELFRQMRANIGPDEKLMSIEERDEKLKLALMTSRKLHPALISPEAEYTVLKKLTGGVVALVLKKQDSRCRLLRTLARELLACAVLQPVLNFATPGYINELIESIATARERERNEKVEESTNQGIPDPFPQKKPVRTRAALPPRGPFESRKLAPDINPLQKSTETYSKIIGDVGTSTLSQPSHDTKSMSMKKVKGITQSAPETVEEARANAASNWAQTLDALAERRAQALAPEHLDNVWAKGRNYERRGTEKNPSPTPIIKDLVFSKTVEADMSPTSGELTSGELSTATIPMNADDDQLDVPDKDKSAMSDQYEALLFGGSNDGEERLPGIGFSPLGTPGPNLGSPEGSTSARVIRGPQVSKTDSKDNSLGSSANSLSTAETGGLSSRRFRYHHKAGSSSQRLRRAVRQLAHRKTKSSGGVSDGWTLDVGSPSPMLNSGEISPMTSPASESRWRSIRRAHSPDVSLAPVQVEATEDMMHRQSTMLDCRVIQAHFERLGSKPFAVYTIRVQDTEDRTWRIQRRFRNFEQLHRRLKDMPYYNLNLPPKRFLSSSLDSEFVKERSILLNKYLKDLLAIPSIAELHEVWDFLSLNSQVKLSSKTRKRFFGLKWFHTNSMAESSHYDQNRNRSSHYTNGNSVSMMRTLAVNVDDAVDDMFRQIRGVSDDLSGALKTATTSIRHRFPSSSSNGYVSDGAFFNSGEDQPAFTSRYLAPPKYPVPYFTDSELSDRLRVASVSDDESGTLGANGLGSQSDSDVKSFSSDSEASRLGGQPFGSGSRLDGAFSDGHSPVESFVSETAADDLGMPQEWSPPKVTVPILNLVDTIFQLQGRGWIRRQVLWMAKQILQLGMGDAIDEWLQGRIHWLFKEEVVASGIHWVKEVLWPDGIFVTNHPTSLPGASEAMLESAGYVIPEGWRERQHRPPPNSFEYQLEARRRAKLVRQILEKAPAAVVNIIGKKQYAKCANDIYYFSQSTVCVKQLTYSLLDMLMVNAFPELHDLIDDVHTSVT